MLFREFAIDIQESHGLQRSPTEQFLTIITLEQSLTHSIWLNDKTTPPPPPPNKNPNKNTLPQKNPKQEESLDPF